MKRSPVPEVEEIRARMRDTFATIYLTLLSIIQGVALAVLFGKVDSLIARGAFHPPQVIMAIGIFLAIVALWNQYQVGLMLYVWTAQLLDAFIPFVFGLTEFAMISGLDRGASAVLAADGALLTVGVVAFEHLYAQVRRTSEPGAVVHRLNRTFRQADALTTGGAAIVCFAAAGIAARTGDTGWAEWIGASLVVAVAVGHMLRQLAQWHTVQRRLADVEADARTTTP